MPTFANDDVALEVDPVAVGKSEHGVEPCLCCSRAPLVPNLQCIFSEYTVKLPRWLAQHLELQLVILSAGKSFLELYCFLLIYHSFI
jgi:hypothetical protein